MRLCLICQVKSDQQLNKDINLHQVFIDVMDGSNGHEMAAGKVYVDGTLPPHNATLANRRVTTH